MPTKEKKAKLHSLASYKIGAGGGTITDEQLSKINKLKKNGPNTEMTRDDIHVRSMIIMGEEPTSHMSIHPERILNGKKVLILSQLQKGLPGAGMLEGHNFDTTPWGRIFDATIIDSLKGYDGKVVKLWFYFLKNDKGNDIAKEIDSGIRAEGSISYTYEKPLCSICHGKIGYSWEMEARDKRCTDHRIGNTYDVAGGEQVCYWYPSKITSVLEVSSVFAGAYPKTKTDYAKASEDFIEGFELTSKLIGEHSLDSKSSFDNPQDSPEESNSNNPQNENGENENEESNKTVEPETEPETEGDPGSESSNSESGDEQESGTPEGSESNSDNVETDPETPTEENSETPSENSITTKLSVCRDCNYTSKYEEYKECPDCGLLCETYSAGVDFSEAVESFNFQNSDDIKPVFACLTEDCNNSIFDSSDLKDLPSGVYAIEPNFKGSWCKISKTSNSVTIIDENDKDLTKSLSDIVDAIKIVDVESFSITGFLCGYKDKVRANYSSVVADLESEETSLLYVMRVNDIVFEGEDSLKNLSYSERLSKLEETIKPSDFIKPVKHSIVEHEKGSNEIVRLSEENRTKDGVIVRLASYAYNEEWTKYTYEWDRLRPQTLKVCVDEVFEDEDGKKSYSCSIGETSIGKTNKTEISANTGEFIEVEIDHVVKNDGAIEWFKPEVLKIVSDSDLLSTLDKYTVKNSNYGIVTLEQVKTLLSELNFKDEVFACEDIVKNCFVQELISFVSKNEEDQSSIKESLKDTGIEIKFCEESELTIKLNSEQEEPESNSNKYVIHTYKNSDGVIVNDIVFGLDDSKTECFSFNGKVGDSKQQACYKFESQKGEDNFNAETFKIESSGNYEVIVAENNFKELKLDGDLNGRYFLLESNHKEFFSNRDSNIPASSNAFYFFKSSNQEDECDLKPTIKYSVINEVVTFIINE